MMICSEDRHCALCDSSCSSYIEVVPVKELEKTREEISKLTNADRIRAMSDEELAKNNIRLSYQCDIDYDYDEESYENWTLWYETSDGSTFYDEESAVEYELDWLRRPAEGEQCE